MYAMYDMSRFVVVVVVVQKKYHIKFLVHYQYSSYLCNNKAIWCQLWY